MKTLKRALNRNLVRSLLLLITAMTVLMLVLTNWSRSFLLDRTSLHGHHVVPNSSRKKSSDMNMNTKKGFLLDTPYCKIPDLDAFDPMVMRTIRRRGDLECSGRPSITYIEGSILKLNRTVIEQVYDGDFKYCQYQPIFRSSHSDFSFGYGRLSEKFDHDIIVPPEDEYMRVYCYSQSEGRLSTNFHAAVTPKETVERRSSYRFEQHKKKNKPKETFNVHMIGVDSVSRLNFIRLMPRTRKFLLKDLDAFEMTGYNKVADNTFVNIVPMMMGKFVQEIGWNETMKNHPFDNYTFFWKNFSRAGYRTLYAEDAPKIAIFVYAKEGFHEPPADYYNRHLALAMEKHKSVWNQEHCIGDRLETAMLLNYVTGFSRVFKDKPYFGFTFITRLTHDKQNLAGAADSPYLSFLKRFKEEGHNKNTILILYSDHGYRFGDIRNTYIGKVEERLPFLYLVFPPEFHKKYPKLVKNLRVNSRRLTTPFDIYETLKDILYFDGMDRKANLKDRGISLFREIPAQRTCGHASILPHWCLCLEQKMVPTEGKLAGKISRAIVRLINNILSPAFHLCAKLKLKQIHSVVKMESNEKILRFTDTFHDVINTTVVYGDRTQAPIVYQVIVSTRPGLAQFEATLTYELEKDVFNLAGDVSRINAYDDQSTCIENFKLKKFCFCRKQ